MWQRKTGKIPASLEVQVIRETHTGGTWPSQKQGKELFFWGLSSQLEHLTLHFFEEQVLLPNLRSKVISRLLSTRGTTGTTFTTTMKTTSINSLGRDIWESHWCKEYAPFAHRIYQHMGFSGKHPPMLPVLLCGSRSREARRQWILYLCTKCRHNASILNGAGVSIITE